jgi:hypothetical protein
MLCEGHGVLSGWMFLRRPDSFDGSFTLVSCAHVLFHISYVIEGGCPGGTSCSARISTALPKPLAHLAYVEPVSGVVAAETN